MLDEEYLHPQCAYSLWTLNKLRTGGGTCGALQTVVAAGGGGRDCGRSGAKCPSVRFKLCNCKRGFWQCWRCCVFHHNFRRGTGFTTFRRGLLGLLPVRVGIHFHLWSHKTRQFFFSIFVRGWVMLSTELSTVTNFSLFYVSTVIVLRFKNTGAHQIILD